MASPRARPFPCLPGGSGRGSPAPRGGVASALGVGPASSLRCLKAEEGQVEDRLLLLAGLRLVRPVGDRGHLRGHLSQLLAA